MHDDFDRADFFMKLGELRAIVGARLATLAVFYEIELEADLASILPVEGKDESVRTSSFPFVPPSPGNMLGDAFDPLLSSNILADVTTI
jgi:hypothetical protein